MDRDQVIAMLRAHERELKQAGIVRLPLFGSTARGDCGLDSDVDLLAAFASRRKWKLRRCVPSSDPPQRFQDILDHMARIEQHTPGMDLSSFMEDHKTRCGRTLSGPD